MRVLKKLNMDKKYHSVSQNTAVNDLIKTAHFNKFDQTENNVSYFFNQTQTTRKACTLVLQINGLIKKSSIKAGYGQLLDFISVKYLEQSFNTNVLTFQIKDYQAFRGHKDSRATTRAIKKELSHLESSSVFYDNKNIDIREKERQGIKQHSTDSMDIVDKYTSKNGYYHVYLSSDYAKMLSKSFSVLIPKCAYAVNSNKFPHVYYITRALCLNARTNIKNEKRANRIKIKTLLDAVPSINTTTKHFSRYTKEPLMDSLNYLTEQGNFLESYDIVDKNYNHVDYEDERMTFREFSNLFIVQHYADKNYLELVKKLNKKQVEKV
jgi:hypothetical protein